MIKQTVTALSALLFCLPALSETPANAEASATMPRKVVETFDFTKKDLEGAIFHGTINQAAETRETLSAISEKNIVQRMDFTKDKDPLAEVDYGAANVTMRLAHNSEAVETSTAIAKATTYTVRGKKYQTIGDSTGFTQEGKASWYGPGFHGRKTASGEIYDMNDMTAAHKRLPLGSRVRVTNLANGKSVIVRINDRGPFHGNRVLDLSKAAAKELGVLKAGTAQVEIQALK